MFGYATDETEECMPLTVVLAHNLNKKLSDLRRDGTLWWARPDTKTQVSASADWETDFIIDIYSHFFILNNVHMYKIWKNIPVSFDFSKALTK